jgi:predicted transposase/invertase (TIGR01784 family)
MMTDSSYIRFDWAIKRILRDKANFDVLEGLMTVLIGQPITITEILESESNQDSREDKFNRVDVKAKTADGEIIIVEVQLAKEANFVQRILFGASKAVIEQIGIGKGYETIKKVYSINVLYFNLGEGSDYAYHGRTLFTGMNDPQSVLRFNNKREEKYMEETTSRIIPPEDVLPEYFLLRVNQFNEVAKTPIEEWMAYLKSGIIKEDTRTPGLQAAREKLNYMRMTAEERRAYEDYMVSVHAARDVYQTAIAEGEARGMAIGEARGEARGMAKGRAETNLSNARKMKELGVASDVIAQVTGMSAEEIKKL